MSEKPTTIPALLLRVGLHLDDYMDLLRGLHSEHPARKQIEPLTRTSLWCTEAYDMLRAGERAPEPAANSRVEPEVPPMTYTVLLPGRRLDPVDCWQVPAVGDVVGGTIPVIVRGRRWISGHEAELVCVYRPGWEPGGESF